MTNASHLRNDVGIMHDFVGFPADQKNKKRYIAGHIKTCLDCSIFTYKLSMM